MDFLDLTLKGDSTLGIAVSPYRKHSSINSTLRVRSCHPPHVLKNTPVGELIRVKRNCTNEGDFNKVEKDTLQRLVGRGYPKWSLDRASKIVADIPRSKLMSPEQHVQSVEKEASVTFSTACSPQFHLITNTLRKYLPVLYAENTLKRILLQPVVCS